MDHIPRPELDPAQIRRAMRVARVLLILLGAGVLIAAAVAPYTNLLWFRYDARQPGVIATAYRARLGLLALGFVPSLLLFGWSLRRALAVLPEPDHLLGEWLVGRARRLANLAALAFAFLFAVALAGEWPALLLARHPQSFGAKDPLFGLDLGFFVFTLPWLRALSNAAFSLFALTGLATWAAYAFLAQADLSRPAPRRHLHALAAAALLAYAAQTWLKRYESGLVDNGQFTGAGYAGTHALAAQTLFAGLVPLVALVVLMAGLKDPGGVTEGSRGSEPPGEVGPTIPPPKGSQNSWLARLRRPYAILRASSLFLLASYLLGLVVWPTLVQRLVVDPDRVVKEAPYAAHAIRATRLAYGIDAVETRDVSPTPAPSAEEVRGAGATLDNLRLWDPDVLRAALEGLQGIRPYYRFRDVDVDRYVLDGKPTLVMLAPRSLDLSGLAPTAQNWTNQRLRYTHGYGVVAARVDRAEPDGLPSYLARDIPQETVESLPHSGGGEGPPRDARDARPRGMGGGGSIADRGSRIAEPGSALRPPPSALAIAEPRLYYTDAQDEFGKTVDEYAVVATAQKEIDYATGVAAVESRWTGSRGIPIGGFLARLAFALRLGDGNLLVSSNIHPESRLLLHRNVVERATRIYPFLRFDKDPYAVVLEGRVVWILDGYTSSEMLPYAAHVGFGAGRLNYIRNSVKVAVDAYTGETTAYAVMDEPVLRAWRAIYPGLVHDDPTKELAAHFRYPEDLLGVQSAVLATYHVTDPATFLGNGDGWSVARERGLSGAGETIRPYYVQIRLPDEPTPGFVAILPFTPMGKPNMIGWLAAHGDPDRYGKVTLYRLAQNPPIAGPEQMESNFSATQEIANLNRQLNNDQSRLIVGNLLVVPVGRSFLYAETLFLQARSPGVQAIPRLTKVILAHNDRVVVADTYREALAKLFGDLPSEPSPPPKDPVASVREALGLLDRADAALRAGDFAGYGRLQKAARERLRSLTEPPSSRPSRGDGLPLGGG